MKTATSILALAGLASAADYADFEIEWLTAHQPAGGKFDYYTIDFNVTSTSGDSPSTAWCYKWWGDSSGGVPWSSAVPVDQWLSCTTTPGGEEESNISFQLFPYHSIGNFTLALRQNFTETTDGTAKQIIATTSLEDPFRFTNTTSTPNTNCTINPFQNTANIHASGDCDLTSPPLSIPIASANEACQHASTVSLSFPLQITTAYGDSVYVTGNITELGNWDLGRAVPLNADGYSSEPNGNVWAGGDVEVAAGTVFEWKGVKQSADGGWLWECGENWVGTVEEFTCGTQVVGSDPTWFRCGN